MAIDHLCWTDRTAEVLVDIMNARLREVATHGHREADIFAAREALEDAMDEIDTGKRTAKLLKATTLCVELLERG